MTMAGAGAEAAIAATTQKADCNLAEPLLSKKCAKHASINTTPTQTHTHTNLRTHTATSRAAPA